MSEKIEVVAEYTDTFGGEANYSWVRYGSAILPANASDAAIRRAAKRALNLTGVRGKWESWAGGEGMQFKPYGMCTVMFAGVLPVNK